jgi:cysteine synthase A
LGTEILGDLARVGRAAPAWIVAGVGSGATSAGIGRCLRQRGLPTRLAVVDPENSAYFAGWVMDCPGYSTGMPSHIEGIGRPRVEAAFDASAVDLVIPVPDAASVAAMRWLRARAAVQAGPSTGAALWGALRMVDRMRRDGVTGSVAAVMADGGAPYADTYYADDWVAAKGWELGGPTAELERFLATGAWPR